jgi:hypothetical protein
MWLCLKSRQIGRYYTNECLLPQGGSAPESECLSGQEAFSLGEERVFPRASRFSLKEASFLPGKRNAFPEARMFSPGVRMFFPGAWMSALEARMFSPGARMFSPGARTSALDARMAFSVQDDGPGIASGHIPRPTGRLYRVDAARSRATGLGLSTVKHVLQRHDAMFVPEVL